MQYIVLCHSCGGGGVIVGAEQIKMTRVGCDGCMLNIVNLPIVALRSHCTERIAALAVEQQPIHVVYIPS